MSVRTRDFVRPLAFLALVSFGAFCAIGDGARGDQPNRVSEFMRPKLQHSQKLLEGLAMEDFELIAKEAQELSLLSQGANWQVLQTEEYLDQSELFRKAVNKVRESAKKKDLDGAARGYFALTAQCISCHKHLRSVRMVSK